MRKTLQSLACLCLLATFSLAQQKRLWVLRAPGEMIEYDMPTFAARQTVKIPSEAVKSPAGISVNHLGQILFAPAISLPLSDEDAAAPHKVWFWNGHAAVAIDQGIEHKSEKVGSNQAVTESAPSAFLSADGSHLFWFANKQRRLQRESVDLSVTTTWQAWQTDVGGMNPQNLATSKFPECRCQTGSCEESCPIDVVWAPAAGVDRFFVLTSFTAGQTETTYEASSLYQENAGKWTASPLPDPLHRVLDASSDGNLIVDAIPDTGCCGWSNQSNDQTIVHSSDKKQIVFDEQATYKNSDYDVSFYTSDAKLSPDLSSIAMTIAATSDSNTPIQLSEQGQANPEESKQIRKSLADLPAVEVKSLGDTTRRIAFVPHASLVGWISDKELLIVEDHLLAVYNAATGAHRKSSVKVADAAHVFLR